MPFMESDSLLVVTGHNIPLLDPILRQMNPVHILTSYLFQLRPVLRNTEQLHRTVLVKKVIVSQQVMKFPAFKEPQGSLICAQDGAAGQYAEPDESSTRPRVFPLGLL
jgi:hypothetical protein